MSRPRDLWRIAAKKTEPPFRRIYFDTEPLRDGNWPIASDRLAFTLNLAGLMNAVVIFPEPALLERAVQWMRKALEKRAKIADATDTFGRFVREFVEVPGYQELVPDKQLDAAYRKLERQNLGAYSIQICQHSNCSLEQIFDWAVARKFTFEEKKDGGGVVGLQDCAILLSVFDDLKRNPAKAAFVSKDGIFQRRPTLARDAGVELQVVDGLDALSESLSAAVEGPYDAEFRAWWDAESQRIRDVVDNYRHDVEGFVGRSLDPEKIHKPFLGRVVSTDPPQMLSVAGVIPNLQSESDRIEFSCHVLMRFTARIEVESVSAGALYNLAILSRVGFTEERPSGQPMQDVKEVYVTLVADCDNQYGDLRLREASLTH